MTIRGSKNDQLREGRTASLRSSPGPRDPVHVFAQLIQAAPKSASLDDPLMVVSGIRGKLRVITRSEAAAVVKRIAQHARLDPILYSTHDMRMGAATTLAHAGIEPRLIELADDGSLTHSWCTLGKKWQTSHIFRRH